MSTIKVNLPILYSSMKKSFLQIWLIRSQYIFCAGIVLSYNYGEPYMRIYGMQQDTRLLSTLAVVRFTAQ